MLKTQPWYNFLIISIQIRIDFKYYKLSFNSSNQIEHNCCLSFNLFTDQPNIALDLNWYFKKNILFINFKIKKMEEATCKW